MKTTTSLAAATAARKAAFDAALAAEALADMAAERLEEHREAYEVACENWYDADRDGNRLVADRQQAVFDEHERLVDALDEARRTLKSKRAALDEARNAEVLAELASLKGERQ